MVIKHISFTMAFDGIIDIFVGEKVVSLSNTISLIYRENAINIIFAFD